MMNGSNSYSGGVKINYSEERTVTIKHCEGYIEKDNKIDWIINYKSYMDLMNKVTQYTRDNNVPVVVRRDNDNAVLVLAHNGSVLTYEEWTKLGGKLIHETFTHGSKGICAIIGK